MAETSNARISDVNLGGAGPASDIRIILGNNLMVRRMITQVNFTMQKFLIKEIPVLVRVN